jgi:hypothetical protein
MGWISRHRRIGPVGAPFVPNPGVNVDALERAGFIERVPDEQTQETKPPAPKVTRKRKD